MIFVDASALVAILTREEEGAALAERLERSTEAATSPLAIYEASLAIARKRALSPAQAQAEVLHFLTEADIVTLSIDGAASRAAIDAHIRYGRGHHPAALNMGDCFAYACAKLSGAELLYKGADFDLTDLKAP